MNYICKFCERECKNTNSLTQHTIRCNQNPDAIVQSELWKQSMAARKGRGTNHYTKAKELGLPIPTISDDTRKKLSTIAKARRHSDETKAKLSKIAKSNGLGGVTQSRWIEYKGKILGSSYELALAKDLDACDVIWDTCTRFEYIDPTGKHRTYTPDFYLPEYDVYLDPKNDFLIENVNPNLGFTDKEKIALAEQYNNIRVIILNKNQLSWEEVQKLL